MFQWNIFRYTFNVISMCNESDQNNTADTPDINSEENIIPQKMTEKEKKRRLATSFKSEL